MAKQGVQGITAVLAGSTLNSRGSILFGGSNTLGNSVFRADSISPPQPIVTPSTGSIYGGAVQLTENYRSISWLSVSGTQSLVLRDTLNQGIAPLVATTGAGSLDRFDQLSSFASANRFDQPVFNGVRNNATTLVSGFSLGYTFLKTYVELQQGLLRPMAADNGQVVVREINTGGVQRVVLYNYGVIGATTTIADEVRFNSLGVSPGISDDGRIVVFQGDLKPDGSASYNSLFQTTSGPGIFASIDLCGTCRLRRHK